MEDNSLVIKQMPVSIEAEQAFLGSIIRKPEAFDTVGGMLTAEDFYLEEHKHIFISLTKMYTESKTIDPVTLANALVESGDRDITGGIQYIALLAESVPSAANVKDYAKIVKDKSKLRKLITVCDEINKEALAARERGSSLLFFPYLAEGRGGFVGVSLASVRGDYALSVMEGVAFRLRSLLAAMDAYGSVSRLILFGGGAKGELWCQIIADVTGMTIAVPNTTEAAGAGAARLAADAVGDSLPPLEIARVYEPGERADYYREKYERYIKTEKRLFEEEN